jgi:hypothetical protein
MSFLYVNFACQFWEPDEYIATVMNAKPWSECGFECCKRCRGVSTVIYEIVFFQYIVRASLYFEWMLNFCVENACMDAWVSELVVVELLDGLCAKMKPYVPNKVLPSILCTPVACILSCFLSSLFVSFHIHDKFYMEWCIKLFSFTMERCAASRSWASA